MRSRLTPQVIASHDAIRQALGTQLRSRYIFHTVARKFGKFTSTACQSRTGARIRGIWLGLASLGSPPLSRVCFSRGIGHHCPAGAKRQVVCSHERLRPAQFDALSLIERSTK